MKKLSILAALIGWVFFPTSSYSYTCDPVIENFGDFLDTNLYPFNETKILYGRFISVDDPSIEDTTFTLSDEAQAQGHIKRRISANAQFQIVDPVKDGARSRIMEAMFVVNLGTVPLHCAYYVHRRYKFTDFTFVYYLSEENGFYLFDETPEGTNVYRPTRFELHGPVSPTLAQEIATCIFDGACSARDIPYLRSLPNFN